MVCNLSSTGRVFHEEAAMSRAFFSEVGGERECSGGEDARVGWA